MITEENIIKPHGGPQTQFLRSNADIAIYGGAAGGGKSYALLLEPLRHVHIPHFRCAIFRRTSEQVRTAGGLWDESCGLYPLVGGLGREQMLDWRWPTQSTIRFEQLQHEQTKLEYQGAQIALIGFDELTHFTETQFFYLLGRNRTTCGIRPYVRCTTNPDAQSWVARFIAWWIDQDTGYALPERSGVKRYFVREDEKFVWSDERQSLTGRYPKQTPKSVTFIPAKLSDNPTLGQKDPDYIANLLALPRVERERLLGGNWKVSESTIIDGRDLKTYSLSGDLLVAIVSGQRFTASPTQCRRFATIDTAGTSKEKAEDQKGKPPSWSVCCVWDYCHAFDALLLRHVWRDRVGWGDLKVRIRATLAEHRVSKAYIENAHYGPSLKDELSGVSCELIGPVIDGMTESHRGAKLERAIAGGLLSRVEDHRFLIPDDDRPWIGAFRGELISWGGLPEETADQIDCSSYACYVVRRLVANWGGTIKAGGLTR